MLEREHARLLALIDGLGHGPAAELAATRAAEALVGLFGASEVPSVLECFEVTGKALRSTRGAAMTVVVVHPSRVEIAGVGNVGLRTSSLKIPFLATAGIVGAQHRPLRVAHMKTAPSGRVVMFSDGISSRFDMAALEGLAPDRACERLLSDHGADHDDATVLVADF
ncbi:MAG: hypothetical protein U0271_28210 [Polyangiaceae bacterium]